jgi:NitT/TauT family transport system ATP-binding protein
MTEIATNEIMLDRRVAVRANEVSKIYGPDATGVLALEGLSLEVLRGEFVCLVGASGCGKTTLLNIIAGLDAARGGNVTVDGRVALLFQDAGLFPWLRVEENVALPMRLRGLGKSERIERAHTLLASVHLSGFERAMPHELSGGMRQRVALARALAQDADILLMDEPFGALDAITRDLLHDELERIWQDTGLTVIFVTHNVREAVRLGDKVAVLSSRPGRIIERFDVPIPRPRRLESPEVSQLAGTITNRLREEVRRHATGR